MIQKFLKKNETIISENTTNPINVSKNNINKKSAKYKSIENIKNNLEKYIKKQQILIQKYENMQVKSLDVIK